MIDLYTCDTSNGQRVAIMLEECGLPFRIHKVDLAKGEQRHPEFLRLNPTGAIPVIDAAGGMPNLRRWAAALAARPGVARAMRPVA